MKLFGYVWIPTLFLSSFNSAYVPVTKFSVRNFFHDNHKDYLMKHTMIGEQLDMLSYRHHSNVILSSKKRRRHNDDDDETILKERIVKVWRDVLEQEMESPANNPNLSPVEFVSKILECLLQPDDPLPNSGYRVLLRSSSPKWKREIQKALGVPSKYSDENIVNEEILASALGSALMRPNNQFGILVNNDDDYQLQIGNILDYQDGTCWVGSRLVSSSTTLEHKVLVIIGWQLVKPPHMDTWTIESIEWQDFRDAYRPGIGREEWSQIIDY